ncbi:hypothetical protein V1264_010444 [Littorina saxatilis]|uniref:Uncharacterized protein n=1 Tax=Littorina saxatilis TaxID=31220 RepID=A0AAN9APE5_9CAEN
MLSHPGVQHVLVEESRSVSGDWVNDVMRTGEDSWQPLVVVMMCSVTCVTSALIQASRLEQEFGTHSAFGMTSRWLLMTSGRENLLSHLNVTNITMDNVAMFDTQLMRQAGSF